MVWVISLGKKILVCVEYFSFEAETITLKLQANLWLKAAALLKYALPFSDATKR